MSQPLQSALQQAIRSALGCANDFNGDLHAMCDVYGIPAAPISGRLIPAANRFDASITDASSALNYFLQNPQNACGTLALDFTRTSTLDPRITFSRGSQATLFDSTGALVYAKHNLLLQSQTFQTTWTVAQASVSADATTAPDGTTTADTIVENTANAEHYARQNTTQSAGSRIAFSVFVKAAGRTSIRLRVLDNAAPSNGFFGSVDTSTGATASGVAGTGTITSVTASALPNGWYRLVVVGIASATATTVINDIFILPTDQNSPSIYTGNGTSGVFLWGAQVNLDAMEGGVTSSLSTYYPTVASAYYAPRFDYNPSTLAAQGLLIEEQRTNSIRNNTMQGAVAGTPGTLPTNWVRFVSGTGATAVIGTGTESGIAYIDVRFTGGNTDGISFFIDGTTGHAALNGQTWTGSSYYKLIAGSFANVTANHAVYEANAAGTALAVSNISLATITSASLATQRLTITRTNNNASTAEEQLAVVCTGTGVFDLTLRIGLPQLEQGAFATSVIPTTTTALTRSADVASMTGTNFSSWYNAAAGTLYNETVVSRQIAAAGTGFVGFDDTTANNAIRNFGRAAGSTGFIVSVGGVTQADLTPTGVLSANTIAKIASAYALNDFATTGNGGAVQIDTSGTIPSVTRMLLGFDVSTGNYLNGWIRKVSYYPVRLPNSTLQALTA